MSKGTTSVSHGEKGLNSAEGIPAVGSTDLLGYSSGLSFDHETFRFGWIRIKQAIGVLLGTHAALPSTKTRRRRRAALQRAGKPSYLADGP